MLSTHLGPSADLPQWAALLACALALASFAMLLVEMRRRERSGVAIAATGLLAVLALFAAVVRPARVSARESTVGARVVVLADVSRSMALAGDDGRPRRDVRDEAIERLRQGGAGVRLVVLGFGDGAPAPLGDATTDESSRAMRCDLRAGRRALAASAA